MSHDLNFKVVSIQYNVPEKQTAVASSSAKLQGSNEGVHVGLSIFVAMAMAKKLIREDLKPRHSAGKLQPQSDFHVFSLGRSAPY